jgi:hypothetical protein
VSLWLLAIQLLFCVLIRKAGPSNGARHSLGGFVLRTGVDSEGDGQRSALAIGDDSNGNHDENGVVFTSTPNLVAGEQANVG